jgi:hypothetical protein
MNKTAVTRAFCVAVTLWVTPLYANTAIIAASMAANNHPQRADIDPWVLWAGGAAASLFVLGLILGLITKHMPTSKWSTRLRISALFMLYPFVAFADAKDNPVRDQMHSLFAVWRKKYVGRPIVITTPTGAFYHTGIGKTSWHESGNILGWLLPPNNNIWINLTLLDRNGGQVQGRDKTWYMTPERWTEAVANYEEEMARQRAADVPREVIDALNTLELTVPATLNDLTAARNRLLKINHPDRGGSTIVTQKINAAYDLLQAALQPAAAE